MAPAEPKERTVGEIMSRPPVTATPDESVATAAARMGEQRVGSVLVVDGDRPVGILTERDLVRLAAGGSDGTEPVSKWMTPDPDSVAPDVEATAAFARLAEHGYRHIPVVDDGHLVGVVSMRDLMRIAQIQPADNLAHEIPRGLEGVVVAETTIGDVRGLEGFYHYRQYNAVELAETHARRRLVPALPHGSADARGAQPVHRRDSPAARDPRLDQERPARHRAGRRRGAAARSPAHDRVAHGCRAGLPAVARPHERRAARAGSADLRRRADAPVRAVPRAARPRDRRSAPRPGVRRELPVHDERRGSRRRSTPEPSSST